MKLFSKFLLIVLVAALAAPFYIKGPNGQPLMTLKDLNLPSFSSSKQFNNVSEKLTGKAKDAWLQWGGDNSDSEIIAKATDAEGNLIEAANNVYYRWKDKDGVWQFTSQPNPNAKNILMKIDPNANIIQSLSKNNIDRAFGRQPASEALEPVKDKKSLLSKEESSFPFPSTVPLEKIPQMIEQAQGIQELSNQRQKMLDRL